MFSSIGSGNNNKAEGEYSTIPGGRNNQAQRKGSIVFGHVGRAKHNNALIVIIQLQSRKWSLKSTSAATFISMLLQIDFFSISRQLMLRSLKAILRTSGRCLPVIVVISYQPSVQQWMESILSLSKRRGHHGGTTKYSFWTRTGNWWIVG